MSVSGTVFNDFTDSIGSTSLYFLLSEIISQHFAGKVFKVMHDKQRGPLSLVRVLNGTLKKGDKVTTATGTGELIQRLYEPLADEYRDIDAVSIGNVAVCAGLKVNTSGISFLLNQCKV